MAFGEAGRALSLPLLATLLLAISAVAIAGTPPLSPASLPDSYSLVYEVTPGGPLLTPGPNTSSLKARFTAGKGRLEVVLASHGKQNKVVKEPWSLDETKALWQQIAKSDLFNFKAEQGSTAPDFGQVALSCEASVGGKTMSTRLEWTSPLRNDGQVWQLINQLDTLMAGPSPFSPKGDASPNTTFPTPPPPPKPLPEKLASNAEIEMLISLEATHLPISLDETSMLISQTQGGSPGEKQRSRMFQALEVLGTRLETRPEDAELHSLRGAFYYDLGEFEKARDEFSAAIRLQPHQADHYNNRGVAAFRQGKRQEAIDDFRKAIKRGRSRYGFLEDRIRKLNGH
jgi:tetratricopeptide (TPR) repeat protein